MQLEGSPMGRFFVNQVLGACVGTALLCGSAQAALMTFTDQLAFEAALGSTQTEGFDAFIGGSVPIIQQIPVNTAFDLGAFNVFYNTADGLDETQNSVGDGVLGAFGSGARLRLRYENFGGANDTTALRFEFDNPLDGFAATWSGFSADFEIQVGSDTIIPFNLIGGSTGFLGFVSDTPFSQVSFFEPTNNDTFFLDDAILGTASSPAQVPVPASLPLLGIGLVGLLALRRRLPVR